MVRPGGGAPVSHRTPPPASSSSTLSPLAPPFTVGQPAGRSGPPYSRSVFNAPVAPYYSPYSGAQPAADDRWDGLFGGDGAGRSGGGRGSSWLEPSSFQEGDSAAGLFPYENSSDFWQGKHVSSFTTKLDFRSECSGLLHGKQSTHFKEDIIAPCSISLEPVSASGALPKGTSFSQLPDLNSNFSSNSYVSFMGYPARACSTAVKVRAPSSKRISSFVDSSGSENSLLIAQPVDPCRNSSVREAHILSNTKELNGNLNADVKEAYAEIIGNNNIQKITSSDGDVISLKTSLPSGKDLAIGNSTGTSVEAESGLKLKPLNLSSAFISECSPAESDNSFSSSQTLDQINLAVDSPCWRGTLFYRQSPFGVAETVGIHPVTNEWKGCNDMDQGQKRVPSAVVYSEVQPSLEQVGTSICDENKKTSESSLRESPIVILTSIQQNLDDANKTRPDCLKDDNIKKNQCSDTCKEQNSEVRKDQNRNSDKKDNEAEPLCKETVVSAVQTITEGSVANLETILKPGSQKSSSAVNSHGGSSFPGNNLELLVKTMHSLSEVLLSSQYDGGLEIKGNDHELLESTIHNLQNFTLKSKTAIGSSSFLVSAPEAPGSQVLCLKTDVIMGNPVHSSLSGNGSKCAGKEPSNINSTTQHLQAFEKVLEKTSCEPEENPEALVYKNLWIEAETALCSMKYELQLARMKIAMDNHSHPMKGRLLQMPNITPQKAKLSSSLSPHLVDAENNSHMELNKGPRGNANVVNEFDALVLARLGVLKGRIDGSVPTSVEQHMHLWSSDFGSCQEMMHIPLSVGDSNATMENLHKKLADPGPIGSKPLVTLNNDTDNRARGKDRIESHGGNYNREFISIAGDVATGGYHVSRADSFPIRPGAPIGQEMRCFPWGHARTASESEQVQNEDHRG